MSTYATAADALLALIQANGYTSATSARDDWNVLNNPANTVVVVEMAEDSQEGPSLDGRGAQGDWVERHTFGVWVCAKLGTSAGGDGARQAALTTATEALKDALRPHLAFGIGSPVQESQLRSTTPPQVLSPRGSPAGGGTHLAQQIVITVWCITSPAWLQ